MPLCVEYDLTLGYGCVSDPERVNGQIVGPSLFRGKSTAEIIEFMLSSGSEHYYNGLKVGHWWNTNAQHQHSPPVGYRWSGVTYDPWYAVGDPVLMTPNWPVDWGRYYFLYHTPFWQRGFANLTADPSDPRRGVSIIPLIMPVLLLMMASTLADNPATISRRQRRTT